MSLSSLMEMVTATDSDGSEEVQSLLRRALQRLGSMTAPIRDNELNNSLSAVVPVFPRRLKNGPLQTGRVTNIIITSLSYAGMCRAQDQSSLELRGTKFDFALLLRHFDYCHEGNSVDFTLLHDFDVEFTDSTGVNGEIPKVDTSRDSIMRTIQSIMRAAQPRDKIVFYFGGHGEHAEVNIRGGTSGDDCDFQTVLAGDGHRIYGEELRAWFCETRYPSVSVTVVVDAGDSGGSLGLPYNYYARGKDVELKNAADIRVPIPMVQISATQPNQVAWSNAYKDGYYSQLAHSLVEYLKGRFSSNQFLLLVKL